MNIPRLLPLVTGLACLLLLSACGSNSTAIQSIPTANATPMGSGPAKYVSGTISAGKTEIPTHIVNAVTGHLDAELRKHGLLATGDDRNVVQIDATTTYYRMRSGFTRMMVGILAGKDGIECEVQLIDKTSHQTVGKFKVSSYNMTAVGGEDDVARMLAAEIAKALSEYKK